MSVSATLCTHVKIFVSFFLPMSAFLYSKNSSYLRTMACLYHSMYEIQYNLEPFGLILLLTILVLILWFNQSMKLLSHLQKVKKLIPTSLTKVLAWNCFLLYFHVTSLNHLLLWFLTSVSFCRFNILLFFFPLWLYSYTKSNLISPNMQVILMFSLKVLKRFML